MRKQVFLAHFEPVLTRFGTWNTPNYLENGPFWDQKCPKMGQKWVKNGFSNNDHGPFGVRKQVFLAHFEPVLTRFGTWNTPNYLENGPFWDQKCPKMGQKWVLEIWLLNVSFAFLFFSIHYGKALLVVGSSSLAQQLRFRICCPNPNPILTISHD